MKNNRRGSTRAPAICFGGIMPKIKCQCCGHCCQGFSGIAFVDISGNDIRLWKKLKIWEAISPFLSTTDCSDSGYIIDFTEHGGKCPFYGTVNDESACQFQEKNGYESKPGICRRFRPGSKLCANRHEPEVSGTTTLDGVFTPC